MVIWKTLLKNRLVKYTVFGGAATLALYHLASRRTIGSYFENLPRSYPHNIYSTQKPTEASEIPTRVDSLSELKSGVEFDILVIGGGCTGSGVALDAATRGLKVAMIEKNDYSSGTSSRSTKLIHGGVRYLEKAFKELNPGQIKLVMEGLRERKHLLEIAPNLSSDVPIIVPLYYRYPEFLFYAPYFWAGMKMYDLLARLGGGLKPSYYMGKMEVLEKFPMLNREGLKGAIVYYDGMHNDARMNLNIALTAATKGATVTNHVEVLDFVKNSDGKINGAKLKDNVTGDHFEVRCKVVINATGCFSDKIRGMGYENVKPAITPSGGVHVVLPGGFSPQKAGVLIPHTEDNRMLFLLPWENSVLAGTTDTSCEIKDLPEPKEDEVQFILKELKKYLGSDIRIEDINASWSGTRPLARDPKNTKSTSSLLRSHLIDVDDQSGLISVLGGKWTTYRQMSEDAVDAALAAQPALRQKALGACVTKSVPLVGAAGWSLACPRALAAAGYADDVAAHLSHNYGYLAYAVADLGLRRGLSARLAPDYPFVEAEVVFGVQSEHAVRAVDILARRTRLAFLNSEAARTALPRVLQIMASEKRWDPQRRAEEYLAAFGFLDTMNVHFSKRHRWSDALDAAETLRRVEMALGAAPLSRADVEAIYGEVAAQGGGGTSRDFVRAVENCSASKAEVRKYIPKLQNMIEKHGGPRAISAEDFVIALSAAMVHGGL